VAGPDGSRILTYFPFNYVDTVEDPYRLVDWMRQIESNTGFPRLLILFGIGDHGGGPSPEMFERIDRLRDLDIFPRIEYGNAETYLDWLMSQELSNLPVWDDELYLEYHRGTYTTQARTKKWNRSCETLLTNAEKFSALGTLFGREADRAALEEAWKNVLFNQFHDILPGSSIRQVYFDSERSHLPERL
jgi:alpha-mannosidase